MSLKVGVFSKKNLKQIEINKILQEEIVAFFATINEANRRKKKGNKKKKKKSHSLVYTHPLGLSSGTIFGMDFTVAEIEKMIQEEIHDFLEHN